MKYFVIQKSKKDRPNRQKCNRLSPNKKCTQKRYGLSLVATISLETFSIVQKNKKGSKDIYVHKQNSLKINAQQRTIQHTVAFFATYGSRMICSDSFDVPTVTPKLTHPRFVWIFFIFKIQKPNSIIFPSLWQWQVVFPLQVDDEYILGIRFHRLI